MSALSLYIRYAARSFIRGRSRSLFGVFCVAIGVASVVALGLTAGNFRNSVTGDARRLNRGDLSVSPPGAAFTLKQTKIFADMKSRGEIADYTIRLQDDTALRSTAQSTVGTIVGVDSKVFPFYDTITANRPEGEPLARLLASPNSAVVSQDTLDTLHLRIGDPITVNSKLGMNRTFTITGVVPDSAVNPFFGAGFWNDFAMVNIAPVASFFRDTNVGASTVYVKTTDAAQTASAKRELKQRLGSLFTVKTVADVAKDQQNQAGGFDKFFRIMGLVAMIIGGIGIINSMMVAARRRTSEIAVLKSLGMKGRQVILVFILESLILALCGTAAGILAGIGISAVVNSVTETFAGNPIPWSLQASPLIAGAAVGIAATILFAYVPTVQASRARPIAVLRGQMTGGLGTSWMRRLAHNMRHEPVRTVARGLRALPMGIVRLPKRQGVRSFFLILAVAAATGYLGVLYTGLFSGTKTLIFGAAAGIGVLVAAGIVTQLFVLVVWLASKLPTLGRLPLRMAFRSMGTQKRRLASTMLALCIGILSVGSVAILAQNMRAYASSAIGHQIGYNAVVQSRQGTDAARTTGTQVARLHGIVGTFAGAVSNSAVLTSVDGKNPNDVLKQKVRSHQLDSQAMTNILYDFKNVEARDFRHGKTGFTMVAGRDLSRKDVGTNHIVMFEDVRKVGVHIGSKVIFADGNHDLRFTVVGIASGSSFSMMANNVVDLTYARRIGMTAPTSAHYALEFISMRPELVQKNLSALRHGMPGALVLDLSNFTSMMNKTINKMELFPIIMGALALFAGVIIIANTVALAMLERRREIAVMKAVGAKRRTVLQFLLLENAFVGFLGALAGVALSMVATALVDKLLLNIGASYDWVTIAGLLALGMVLAMAASSLTALPASTERPMAVLRYE